MLKFILLITLTTATIFIKNWFLLITLLFLQLIYINFQKKKNELLSRIAVLLPIALLIILFQLFFNTSLSFNERITNGIYAALRIMDLSLLVFIFSTTTSTSSLLHVFSFLPPKIRLAITITFSLIPVILEEAQQIALVQAARGHRTHSLKPWQNLFPLLIPLLHRSLNRAEQIAQVIMARGFNE